MRRGLLGSLLGMGIALAAPGAAHAFVAVSVSGSTLTITGTNVAPSPQVGYITAGTDRFEVIDAGGATAGSGCNQISVNEAECDDGGITSVVMTAQAGAGTVMNGTISTAVPASVSVTLNGGDGNEVFTSGNGNDTLHGNAGSNDINGGSGNDTIDAVGSTGSQIYTGDDGADIISSGPNGNNILLGGTDISDSDDEGDTLTGGSLIDTIDGSGGDDTINAGDDEDDVTGGEGNDILNMGPGNDGDSVANPVDGGPGNDTLNGDAGDDILNGGENSSGPEDSDTLNGGIDDDVLVNSDGADNFVGGANNAGLANGDEVDYSDTPNTAAITADIDGASGDDGRSGEGDSITSAEHLTGDGGADTLTGDGGVNRIDGAGGDDILRGGSGTGPDGGDNFIGGTNGATGDLVSYDLRTDALNVSIDGTADDGGGGCPSGGGCEDDDVETSVENLTGGSAADILEGSTGSNVLRGGSGTAIDDLRGLAGNDTMFGGTGANTGPDGADELDGGADVDEVSYASRSDNLVLDADGANDDGAGGCPSGAGCEDDDISTVTEELTGGSGDDDITGANAADNILNGSGGVDTLSGGTSSGATDGSDAYNGGSGGEDTVDYSSRTADLIADIGTVSGADSDNIGADIENLIGGSGDDDLGGDGDANDLTGGGGDDHLRGGLIGDTNADNADVFVGGTDGTPGGLNGDFGDLVRYDNRNDGVHVTIGGGANDGAGGCPAGGGCEDDNVGTDIERVFGTTVNDTLIGDSQVNDFFGSSGDDTISGGAGTGADGADLLDGGANGAAGDTLSYSTRADALTITLGSTAPDGDQIFTGFENVTGGSGNDTIRGDSNPNVLTGGGGDDELRGGTVTGADGTDEFNGGANGAAGDTVNYVARSTVISATIGEATGTDSDDIGSDVENLTGGSNNDILRGDADPNVISGGNGDDNLVPTAGAGTADGPDTIIGGANGAGGDSATYFFRTDPVVVTIGGGANDGAGCAVVAGCEGDDVQADVENLGGGGTGDTLTGDNDANALQGGGGDDVMAGGTGTGPDGGDSFQAGAPGALGDTVTYTNRTDAISADIAGGFDDTDGDNLFSDIDNIVGGSGPDTLTGDANPNRITGGAGADTLSALGGADTVLARDGVDDTIDCGTETDVAELDLLPLDDPATGCETANRAQFSPPVDPPPGGGGAAGGGGGGVVSQPAAPPAQKKKCKKGRKLKKGKCVKKPRKKR